MAQMFSVKLKVTASETLRYWMAIDNDDVAITNGEAIVQLKDGEQYVLVWWMLGNSGDSIAVLGKAGEREVVNVKESKIPAGASKGAGYRKFKV
jgi:hypothetical protein